MNFEGSFLMGFIVCLVTNFEIAVYNFCLHFEIYQKNFLNYILYEENSKTWEKWGWNGVENGIEFENVKYIFDFPDKYSTLNM